MSVYIALLVYICLFCANHESLRRCIEIKRQDEGERERERERESKVNSVLCDEIEGGMCRGEECAAPSHTHTHVPHTRQCVYTYPIYLARRGDQLKGWLFILNKLPISRE